jgi:general secretion pathway protein N
MKRAILLVVLLFVATLLIRLPAAVLPPLLPPGIECAGPEGTLWTGSCAELRAQGVTVNGVGWHLHPLSLLRLTPQLDVTSADPRLTGSAQVQASRDGRLDLSGVKLTVDLRSAPAPLPMGWSGSVQAQLDSLQLRGQQLLSLRGRITAAGLVQLDPHIPLGDFELVFRGTESAPPLHGQLRDTGNGPLAIAAGVTLSAAGGYDIAGTVSARSGADPQLTQVLELFGPADAQGRRSFSLAGSL